MSIYTFFVLQPYTFLAHNIHIIDINNSEYNSIKQGGIKYHFLSLWYVSTWDWAPVSQTIGEHSTH